MKEHHEYINFDLEEMKKAVEAPSVTIPEFETAEELREWMLGLKDEDFSHDEEE